MKKVMLTVLLNLAVLCLFGQQETLFGRTRVVGGFGGPIFEMGLNNGIYTAAGGGGGVIINSFFLGGYGLGSVDFESLLDENDEIDHLDMGHGGLWLGFNVAPHKLVHLYASTRIGWGVIDVDFDDRFRFSDEDQIFVFTPEAGLELNVTRWFRVAGTVGYRFLDGVRTDQEYSEEDFEGAMVGITLRFGGFGSNRDNW